MSTPPKIPEVFILWHPDCPLGEQLAKRIYAWLRPGNGVGPQVFYRSLPAAEAGGLPPPLPKEKKRAAEKITSAVGSAKVSNLQILLPLIDQHMVADPAWRYWLSELSNIPPEEQEIMPVALDTTAYNMPGKMRRQNYLRPIGLPLADDATTGMAFEAATRSLLKQLTEAMCRLLLRAPEAGPNNGRSALAALPKVTLFLSHAKVDGTGPAKRLRNYIYSQTQLAAFYDENDIVFGGDFGEEIENALGASNMAAMIVIRSAQYANRPWCRRELSLFRKPRRIRDDRMERWQLFPTLVVEALDERESSLGIPELGNSSLIRWSQDRHIEEQIVTTVMRDAMLAAFHTVRGAELHKASHQIIINWLPDPTTMLHILTDHPHAQELDVVYPGRGLSGLELKIMREFFPQITFHSFEEVSA
ncbi:MAG: toll/interleukin-1 receptor domain-containing protein [Blastocatellia bacterium]